MPNPILSRTLAVLVAATAPLSAAHAGELDGATSIILTTCEIEGWQMALRKTVDGKVDVDLSPTLPEAKARCVYQQVANHDLILAKPSPYQLMPHDDTGSVPTLRDPDPVNHDAVQPH